MRGHPLLVKILQNYILSNLNNSEIYLIAFEDIFGEHPYVTYMYYTKKNTYATNNSSGKCRCEDPLAYRLISQTVFKLSITIKEQHM